MTFCNVSFSVVGTLMYTDVNNWSCYTKCNVLLHTESYYYKHASNCLVLLQKQYNYVCWMIAGYTPTILRYGR